MLTQASANFRDNKQEEVEVVVIIIIIIQIRNTHNVPLWAHK